MQQSFSLFGLTFYYYGLLVGIAIFLVFLISIKEKTRIGLKERDILFCFLITLPFMLLFARLYHVLDNWEYYFNQKKEIFNLTSGGMGIFGALAGFFIGIVISSFFLKIKTMKLLNFFAPYLLLAQGMGRLGNFFNHEIYSSNNLPIFLIEAIFCIGLFIVFLFLRVRFKFSFLGYYLLSYGIVRFITEFWRTDTWMLFNIKIAHFLSLIFIISGAVLLKRNVLN